MPAQLKRYYLMHLSYWLQQLIILALRLEKPRKDFRELVAHHIVTIWLIGFVISLIFMGFEAHIPFLKLELFSEPDTHRQCCFRQYGPSRHITRGKSLLSSLLTKLTVNVVLQAVQLSTTGENKSGGVCGLCGDLDVSDYSTGTRVHYSGITTFNSYFRHWLNIVILWSVWNEFELIP